MWTIAARVEPNRGGSSARKFRLYALPGQPVSDDVPISCPVDERHNGRFYLVNVAMTAASPNMRSYPYVLNMKTIAMTLIEQGAALAHVQKTFGDKRPRRK
ncbi:hypothetical protein GmRootV213_18220 [Variovorax sp. V213]|uniref:hypothetical protein n=1 Tax=Variovorax sp. V213 TaxID=3065955 RepID=UPI0034E8BDD4